MTFDAAQYGFALNNREIAALIYLLLTFSVLFLWKGSHSAGLAVIRAFFAPKLAQVWVAMTLYVITCVYLLAWLNLWTWPNLKSTLLWWVTVGFTSLFEASRLKKRPDSFRALVLEAFTITAALVFIVELVSFPLWIELLMLPALVFLALITAVAELRPEHAVALNLFRGVQALVGFLILGFSLMLVMESAPEFWSLNTLRDFCLPLLLWVLFVPFIFLLAVIMVYQDSFVFLKIRPRNAPIVDYAQWRALLAFGLDMDAVRRLSRDLRNRDIGDRAGVRDAIQEIKMLQKRQKNPPAVDIAEGWSPYEARLFLKKHGIVTGDYHRTLWEWRAEAPAIKLSDKTFADSVTYSISGTENAATKLHLSLDASKDGTTRQPLHAFHVRALTLLSKVFNDARAKDVLARAKSAKPNAVEVDGIKLSYDSQQWGEGRIGRYSRGLTIRHPQEAGNY